MDKNKKNVPKIRFPGFEGAWEKRKLNECIETSNEKNIDDVYNKDDVLSVSGDFGIVNQIEFQGRSFAGASVSNYGVVNTGSIVYTKSPLKRNPFGIIKTNKGKPGIVSTLYAVYKPKENTNPNFVQCYFESDYRLNNYLKPLVNKGAKNDMKVSDDNALLGFVIFPSYEEQTKISVFFETLDNLITLHQRKLEHLKDKKKGLLQKMFPKEGEKFPELRFPGFTAPWEQRKLGEVCEVTMGQSPNGSTYSEEPSDYILVQGNADLKDGWVFPRIWTTQKTKTAQAGDLIMSVRAPAGAMGKTAYDVVLGRGVAGIKGNEFVYQTLVKFDAYGYWKKIAAGSTFESINSDTVKNAIILIPQDIDEQKKIGDYFFNLDHLITLHQRKLEHLQQQKKGLLQQMFI